MENPGFERSKDDPPQYEELSFSENGFNNGETRATRPSVTSAFGHNTLDRVPNVDFYRNADSISGHRAVRPSLQELHDIFQKVSHTWKQQYSVRYKTWKMHFKNKGSALASILFDRHYWFHEEPFKWMFFLYWKRSYYIFLMFFEQIKKWFFGEPKIALCHHCKTPFWNLYF